MASGSNWERDVCKFLSLWVQGTEKPYLFWRGRGSGSVFTRDDLSGESFAGDIYHVREEGKFITDKFTIECKAGYPQTSLDNHLKYNKKDWVREFWLQTINDAHKTNKFPMLIYKKKGFSTPWLGICENTFPYFKESVNDIRYIHVRYEDEIEDIYFFELYEFFNNINIDEIKSIKRT